MPLNFCKLPWLMSIPVLFRFTITSFYKSRIFQIICHPIFFPCFSALFRNFVRYAFPLRFFFKVWTNENWKLVATKGYHLQDSLRCGQAKLVFNKIGFFLVCCQMWIVHLQMWAHWRTRRPASALLESDAQKWPYSSLCPTPRIVRCFQDVVVCLSLWYPMRHKENDVNSLQ